MGGDIYSGSRSSPSVYGDGRSFYFFVFSFIRKLGKVRIGVLISFFSWGIGVLVSTSPSLPSFLFPFLPSLHPGNVRAVARQGGQGGFWGWLLANPIMREGRKGRTRGIDRGKA